MNDVLINDEIKEAVCKLFQIAAEPAIVARALSECCDEYGEKLRRFPHATEFWGRCAKAFGSAHFAIFVAQKDFKKLTK